MILNPRYVLPFLLQKKFGDEVWFRQPVKFANLRATIPSGEFTVSIGGWVLEEKGFGVREIPCKEVMSALESEVQGTQSSWRL